MGAGQWAAVVAGAVLGGWLLGGIILAVVVVFTRHPSAIVVGVFFAVSGVLYYAERLTASWTEEEAEAALRSPTLADLDALDGPALTLAVRDLVRRDGCAAEAGSRGLLAETPEGRRLHIRVESARTDADLDARAVLAARDAAARGRRSAVVVTNGSFTVHAHAQAATSEVHLVDRELLRRWCEEGKALTDLLPPRRAHG
ncbi:restriction endonuclease [Actinocorallia sp. A-T 12471]|uniref:restriction endonuclease n=1 Tax=Actinocorallia sp. A-T 12471 TaxID=3089813 RepID=UPI0029CF40C9|nr:restriction endonuclease [Actinocorallia sp. A-T 12471]MDX6742809.1 restriction endonuclease [Actinocorallia sp. A-T 12471]